MYCLFLFCLGIYLGTYFDMNYFSNILKSNTKKVKKNKIIKTEQNYCDWEIPDINKVKEVELPINIQTNTEKTKNKYWFF